MKLGVVSDSHDNLQAISAAMHLFEAEGVEAILHAGDFCAPFALKRILQTRTPVHAVFGNCDGERAGLMKLLPDLADGPLHLELDGRKVALIHIWERLSHEDREAADIIVYGHTHEPKVEHTEGRLILNPGECCGWTTGRCTAALVDTDRMTADVREVREQARS